MAANWLLRVVEPSFLIAIVALVVAVTVGLRLAAGMFDGERIRAEGRRRTG